MKAIIKLQIIVFSFFIIVGETQFKANAQGIGNHVTMSVGNCMQTSLNEMQFDLLIVSDGFSTSDLSANAFQYGINFNTSILQPGATISASFVNGTSDFIPPLNNFSFPFSSYPDHIRIVQSPYISVPSNTFMSWGHAYRVGTFILTSSLDWEPNTSPNFTLQDSVVECKTACAALIWVGTSPVTDVYYMNGTGNGQRSLSATCNIILTPTTDINELTHSSGIKIYPSLIVQEESFNISSDESIKDGELNVFNMMGEKVYSDAFNGKRKTVNCKLSSGVYFVRVSSEERQWVEKIIIE